MTIRFRYSPSDKDSLSVSESGVFGGSSSESKETGIRHLRVRQKTSNSDGRHSCRADSDRNNTFGSAVRLGKILLENAYARLYTFSYEINLYLFAGPP